MSVLPSNIPKEETYKHWLRTAQPQYFPIIYTEIRDHSHLDSFTKIYQYLLQLVKGLKVILP